MNSFLELRERLLSNAATRSSSTKCLIHNDLLRVYCVTCCQVICRDCTISTEHKTHNFELISECYTREREKIQDNLDIVKDKMATLDTAVLDLTTRERQVVEQGEQLQEQINTHAQQIIDQVQMSRQHLSLKLQNIVKRKMQLLAAQRQQAQRLRTQLNTCQQMIEHSINELTEIQLITDKQALVDNMTMATQNFNPKGFQPIEKVNIKFMKTDVVVKGIGLIKSIAYGKDSLNVLPCLAKEPSKATLTLQTQDGLPFSLPTSLISSTLSSPGDTHSVNCDVTQNDKAGKYSITFTPSTRQDQLIVQVGGVDISDSPFTLPVIPTPEMRGKPVNIITGLNGPFDTVKCDNGDTVVAECGAHCITIFNKEGKKVRSFGTEGTKEGQFTRPRGVAITNDGHILVTDDHRLQKLTTDGVCVKSVGSSDVGNGQLQFNTPIGITVNPTTGQIFVTDYNNNRIQVFNNDLTFSRIITLKGNKQLNAPYDVALDQEGCLYVADSFNHCITKVNTKGQHVTKFGLDKSAPHQLFQPTSLTIDNNIVYVSEAGNNRISIFRIDGTFLHCFGKKGSGEGEFNGPHGIAMDCLGNLYVSDSQNNRIVVY